MIYAILAAEFGKTVGLQVYKDLGIGLREICGTPLFLNMVIEVHGKSGKAPSGRAELYRDFVDLLLEWDPSAPPSPKPSAFWKSLSDPLTSEKYNEIAQIALTNLARTMTTTETGWIEAQNQFASTLARMRAASAVDARKAALSEDSVEIAVDDLPQEAAAWLLGDLRRVGDSGVR